MDLIFASLKKLKKHGFDFFASLKSSKNMDLIFCKLKEAQKRRTEFLASLKKLKKQGFNFSQA